MDVWRKGSPVGLAEGEVHYLPPRAKQGHLCEEDDLLNENFVVTFKFAMTHLSDLESELN